MSTKQSALVEFVSAHPGATAMDCNRREWAGPGHAATYARVNRLLRRGILRRGPSASGRGHGLYVAKVVA